MAMLLVDVSYTASDGQTVTAFFGTFCLGFSLIWMCIFPPNLKAQKLNLNVTWAVLLPMRAFVPIWYSEDGSYQQLPSIVSACLMIQAFGACLNQHFSEQLTLTFFVNFVVFTRSPATECVLSALASPLSCLALVIKNTKMEALIGEFDTQESQQRAEIEKLRRQQAEQAVAAETAKAESYCRVVSATAHDMRTPVAALKSGVAIMRHHLERDQLPPKEMLDSMDIALVVALDFLNSMVLTAQYLSKADREKHANRVVVSLNQLVREACACISHGLSSDTILQSDISEELSKNDRVICDRSLVLRSMINLLGNASRHTSEVRSRGSCCLNSLSHCLL